MPHDRATVAGVEEQGDALATQAVEAPSRELTILIAEDNPVNQEIALGLVESLDGDAVIVDNGAEALKAYQTAPPGHFHLILMDCQMPVMDGFEASRRIRAWENEGTRIPIIAITANAAEGSKASCLEAGMDDMLNKPFRHKELKALLDQWHPHDEIIGLPEPETPPSAGCSVLDQSRLQSLFDLDPDGSKCLVHRAIIKFADYGDDLIAKMTTAMIAADRAEVARLAHSLKSSSGNLGAIDLASQCSKIERLTSDPKGRVEIGEQLDKLAKTFQVAKQALLSIAAR